jgi:hypothetical protein
METDPPPESAPHGPAPAQPPAASEPVPPAYQGHVYAAPVAPAALPLCRQHATPSPCIQPADAYRHDGFYLRVSGALGYVSFAGSGPSGDVSVSGLGLHGMYALGGTVGEGLVIAAALGATLVSDELNGLAGAPDVSAGEARLGVVVDWFPDPHDGWHVGGFVGLSGVVLSGADIVDGSGSAVGGTITGGYDWWIGPQWSLGLLANLSATTRARLLDRDGDETGYDLGGFAVTFGYALTLH